MKSKMARKTAKTNLFLLVLALFIVAVLIFLVFQVFRMARPGVTEVSHLRMGNPSAATANPANPNNFLCEKKYYALAYNNSKGTPNWVSWRLGREDLGPAPRVPFYPDAELPAGLTRITPRDYTGSGFDRGHMCPHGDRSATPELSHATFVMTNIIPQSPNVNEKAWDQLEEYCRDLVRLQGKTLYIISGPAGQGGEGRSGRRETIGTQHKVTVPASCWKVIMVLDSGTGDDLARVNGATRLIAVIMPNTMAVGEAWAGYRVSVREVEQLTGYTFFDRVPPALIQPLKEKVDRVRIPPPRAPRRAGSAERSGSDDQ